MREASSERLPSLLPRLPGGGAASGEGTPPRRTRSGDRTSAPTRLERTGTTNRSCFHKHTTAATAPAAAQHVTKPAHPPLPPRSAPRHCGPTSGSLLYTAADTQPTTTQAVAVASSSSLLPPLPSPAPPLLLLEQPPVREWAVSARVEQAEGRRAFHLARELFLRVVEAHPQRRPAFDLLRGGTHGEAEETAEGQVMRLVTRVAVSALLLQEVVFALPRHQRVLEPYVRMLLRAVYVPEGVQELYEALDGDLSLPAVLDGLRMAIAEGSADAAPGHAAVVRTSLPRAGGHAAQELLALLTPFARKPYLVALAELTRRTTGLAHAVRAQQLHARRLPRIFAMTHVSWTSTLLRTVVRAWWKLCAERRAECQKHRMRWAHRWSAERVRVGIRRWRGLAAYTLKVAEADSATRVALTAKREAIQRYLVEVESMRRTSVALTLTLEEKVAERAGAEQELVRVEHLYGELLRRVRHADRVGAALLDALLLPAEEKAAALWAGATMGTTTLGLPHSPAEACEDGATGEFAARPRSCCRASTWQRHDVTALDVLVRWADGRLATAGQGTEELCARTPSAEGEGGAGAGAGASPRHRRVAATTTSSTPGTSRIASPLAEGAVARPGGGEGAKERPRREAGGPPAPLDSEAVRGGGGGAAVDGGEPVFTQLLPTATTATATVGGGGGGASGGPSAFVPVPLYKYLVLMRCFAPGWTPDPMSRPATDSPTAAGGDGATTTAPTPAGQGDANASSECSFADVGVHPHAPPIDAVRVVKAADAMVLSTLAALRRISARRQGSASRDDGHDKDNDGDDHDDGNGESTMSGADLLEMLPAEVRSTAENAAKIVTDAYERLTGTVSVVTASQLVCRTRRVQLVFLAALFRHYTNWAVRRARVEEATAAALDGVPMEVAIAASLSTRTDASPLTDAHVGRRHIRYSDWHHPPSGHLAWAPRVANQQGWVALSFSALHRALRESTRQPTSLSVEEQDLAVNLVRALSLSRIADVLPTTPAHMTAHYVGLIRAVEQNFARLRHLFRLYAVPLADITASRQGTAAGGGAKGKGGKPGRPQGGGDGGATAELFMSANSFWHLLCDARVAGGDGTALTSTTLHRVAVFAIVEHVVFHPSRGGRGGGEGSPRGADGAQGYDAPPIRSADDLRPRQVGTERVVPLFARAVAEQRHADLRPDRATVCMRSSQFVEALIRCAHYWQALQMSSEAWARSTTESALDERRDSAASMDTDLPSTTTAASTRATTRRGSLVSGLRPSASTATATPHATPTTAAITATTAAQPCVRYDGVMGGCAPLSPLVLERFLEDMVLAHCLAGPGGVAHAGDEGGGGGGGGAALSAPTPLPAFRRSIRAPAVQKLLARHQDELFTVFAQYARAREAFGMRGALPPPFAGASPPPLAAPPRLPPSPTTGRRSSRAQPPPAAAAAAGRDVGIVSVLSFADVEALAKGLGWHRVSPNALRHCFDNVVADRVREAGLLFFTEFLDFLCAVACYVEVSPFVPLAVKLERFLPTHVLHALPQT